MVDGDALKHPLHAFTSHRHAAVRWAWLPVVDALVDGLSVFHHMAQIKVVVPLKSKEVGQRISGYMPVISYPLDKVKDPFPVVESVAVDLLSSHFHLVNAKITELILFVPKDVLISLPAFASA